MSEERNTSRMEDAERLRKEKEAWEKLTPEERQVYSDLNHRALQFSIQLYIPHEGPTVPAKYTKVEARKLVAKLAQQWIDNVNKEP